MLASNEDVRRRSTISTSLQTAFGKGITPNRSAHPHVPVGAGEPVIEPKYQVLNVLEFGEG